RLRRTRGAVCLVVTVDAESNWNDSRTTVSLLLAIRLDEGERGIDETCFAHQHQDRLHGRRTRTDVDDQFPIGELSPHGREPLSQELEDLSVIGRIVTVPRLLVNAQARIPRLQLFQRLA